MNQQNVCDALQYVGTQVSGIESAYSEPPLKMDTAMLPCFYVLMGAASYDQESLGDDFGLEQRTYSCRVAIAAEAEAKPNLLEVRSRVLIPLVRDGLLKYAALHSLSDAPLNMTINSDTGVIRLPEYGGGYFGFGFTVTVQTVFTRTFAAGE